MLKMSNLRTKNQLLTVSVIILSFMAVGVLSVSAQEVAAPAVTDPVPMTPDAATATATVAVTPEAIVDPATGLPAMPVVTPAVDTQTAAGTYETLGPEVFKKLDESMNSMAILRPDRVKPEAVGTLVFTLWQHSLLQDAKKLFRTRRPTENEIAGAADGSNIEETRPRGVRELGLGGILFKGTDNWIVWLNGNRMAPDALPKEVIDIKVTEDYIDLKWFDAYTNLIYPIRLRPHQRFNLDTRIFLPGLTADAAAQLRTISTGN